MAGQSFEEAGIGADFCVQVSARDAELLAEGVDRDAVAGVELQLLDHCVSDGGDVAGLVAKFEHDCSFSHASQPTERSEVLIAFGIVIRAAAGVFVEQAVTHGSDPFDGRRLVTRGQRNCW